MAKAKIVEIGDAVVELLRPNIETRGGSISRVWWTQAELENEQALAVDVFTPSDQRTRQARGSWQEKYTIEVGVRQRVPQNAGAFHRPTLDSLCDLVLELAAAIEDEKELTLLETSTSAFIVSVSILSMCDADQLEELRQFSSVISAEYWTHRIS